MGVKRKIDAISGVVSLTDPIQCTIAQMLYFTLDRQGLIRRKSHVSSDLFPLHATLHTTPCLSLYARVNKFKKLHMSSFISVSENSPLKYTLMRCMRGTLHIIPSAMFNTVASAYNFIGNPAATTRVDQFKVKMKEVVYFSELIMNKLLEHGPMSATNLVTCVQESEVSSSPFKVKSYNHTSGKWTVSSTNVKIALAHMYSQSQVQFGLGSLVTPANQTSLGWKTNSRLYGYANLCYEATDGGDPKLTPSYTTSNSANPSSPLISTSISTLPNIQHTVKSLEDLMEWYFHLYSPASFQDFVWWSGKKVGEVRSVFNSLLASSSLVEVRVIGLNKTLYCSSTLIDSLVSSPSLPSHPNVSSSSAKLKKKKGKLTPSDGYIVRFLPYEDAILKAYKDTRFRFYHNNENDQLLVDQTVESCFMYKGEAMPSIWIDGQVIGGWQWKNSKKAAECQIVKIFTPTACTEWQKCAIQQELLNTCEFLDISEPEIEYYVGSVR